MTSKDLLDASMHLDHSFLDEADARAAAAKQSGRKRIRLIPAMTAAAACLTAVFGLRMYLLQNNGMTAQNSTAESIIEEVTGTEMTETALTGTALTEEAVTSLVKSSKNDNKTDSRTDTKTDITTDNRNDSRTEKTTAVPPAQGTEKTESAKAGTPEDSKAKTVNPNDSSAVTDQPDPEKTEFVPDFLSLTWRYAQAEAARRHLKVTKTIVSEGIWGEGTIQSQSIPAWTEVPQGTVIELTVCEGEPEYQLANVPDFTGLTWGQAEYEAMYRNLNLKKIIVSEGEGKKGTIQSQDVEMYTYVEPGTTITLYLLEGEPDPIRAQLYFYVPMIAKGTYHITLYENGAVHTVGPEFIPEFTRQTTMVELSGSGVHIYDAMLVSNLTGEEAKIGRYRVDYDSLESLVFEADAFDAFLALGGVSERDDPEECVPFSKMILVFPRADYYKINNASFKIPANAKGIYKIAAFTEGIKVSESDWFDASEADAPILLTMEDTNPYMYHLRQYVYVMYAADPDAYAEIGCDRVEYDGRGAVRRNYDVELALECLGGLALPNTGEAAPEG